MGSAPRKNSHCSYCGHAFGQRQPWPRVCTACRSVSYRNPLPVAVLLLPVGDGLLVIRRGERPRRGQLALPGGFIEFDETWQQAAARELYEETNVVVPVADIADYRVRSAPDGTLVVFGLASPIAPELLPPFEPNPETEERLIIREPIAMAFDLHQEAVQAFFSGVGRPP